MSGMHAMYLPPVPPPRAAGHVHVFRPAPPPIRPFHAERPEEVLGRELKNSHIGPFGDDMTEYVRETAVVLEVFARSLY